MKQIFICPELKIMTDRLAYEYPYQILRLQVLKNKELKSQLKVKSSK